MSRSDTTQTESDRTTQLLTATPSVIKILAIGLFGF